MPTNHFHCAVTSPPYFALRSYLPADHPMKSKEIGNEPTPEAFIETMVRVFREVRRVLHPSGLLFLNLGDGYSRNPAKGQHNPGDSGKRRYIYDRGGGRASTTWNGLGDGQLLNIPHRVAEALRQDGWLWRQTIVWSKRSPMPESVRGWRWERCRVKVAASGQEINDYGALPGGRRVPKASGGVVNVPMAEHVDCPGCPKCEKHAAPCPLCSDATGAASDVLDDWILRQPPAGTRFPDKVARLLGYAERGEPCPMCGGRGTYGGYLLRRGKGRCTMAHEYVFVLSKTAEYFWDSAAFVEEATDRPPGNKSHKAQTAYRQGDEHHRRSEGLTDIGARKTRNPRSVWHLSSEPTSVAHFATYPSELVRRCVQAGTSDGGCCSECGTPWAPVVKSEQLKRERPNDRTDYHDKPTGGNACGNTVAGVATNIVGYRATCECGAEGTPCRVLDPFVGVGTTARMAAEMGRRCWGIDINREYLAYAQQALEGVLMDVPAMNHLKPARAVRRRNVRPL